MFHCQVSVEKILFEILEIISIYTKFFLGQKRERKSKIRELQRRTVSGTGIK